MTKDEALKVALNVLRNRCEPDHPVFIVIKAALEANEFNPDWDTQAVLTEEIQRMAKRIEELEAKDEPVATKNSDGVTLHLGWDDLPVGTKLYATPPQRTWVGLTDEEIFDVWLNETPAPDKVFYQKLCRSIEFKLRSKNYD